MEISIGIVARNEEKNLPAVLGDLLAQDYPHGKTELILIDSMSEDGTAGIMRAFAKQHEGEFKAILVMENPGRILCRGWNRAIDAFTTDALVRVDAHSSIPPDFIRKNVEALESGENVTGGARPNIVEDDSPWQNVLLAAESSMFGSSAAPFRRGGEKTYVKSLFHGAYRREVFEKAGRFREDLGRTEDNEFNYRVRQHGFRLCMVPGIISYQKIRPDLGKMCRQKFANGYWVGLTAGVCPGCLSLYHFVPFAFVAGIVATTALASCSLPWLAVLMWSLYWLLAVVMAVQAAAADRGKVNAGYVLLPFLFFLLHVSYGVGTAVGLAKMPFWRNACRQEKAGETREVDSVQGEVDSIPDEVDSVPEEVDNILDGRKEYTEEELKGLQRISLEMAGVFVEFCEEFHLLCYFCGGGCIGAVRHKGFIPWDDDLDFFMPREDYEKFVENWNAFEKGRRYVLSNTTKDYVDRNNFATLRDSQTTQVKPYQKDLDIPHGVALDILPLDGCPDGAWKRKRQCMWALVYSLFRAQTVPEKHGGMMAFGSRMLLAIFRGKGVRYHIWKMAERHMTKYPFRECRYITELCSGPYYMKKKYRREWFEKALFLEFEEVKMPVPAGYDGYLREAFGDYMQLPPEEKRKAHHDCVRLDLNRPCV